MPAFAPRASRAGGVSPNVDPFKAFQSTAESFLEEPVAIARNTSFSRLAARASLTGLEG